MRPALAVLVTVGTLSAIAAHAQTPQILGRPSEQSAIVEGCLSKKQLKPDLTALTTRRVFEALEIKELVLEGPKGVMDLLQKEHDGHQDEITGVIIVPAGRDTKVQGGAIGPRTRVTGVTSADPDPRSTSPRGRVATPSNDLIESQQWLRMKVTSLRHISDKCHVAGGGLFGKDGPGH